MNSVSWFLYASDVIGNIQPTIVACAVLSIIAAGVCMLVYCEDWDGGPLVAKRLMFCAVPALFIACLIPSQKTMYAIAASQIGERVAENEAVQGIASDATKALQQWIKKQIEPEAAKK